VSCGKSYTVVKIAIVEPFRFPGALRRNTACGGISVVAYGVASVCMNMLNPFKSP